MTCKCDFILFYFRIFNEHCNLYEISSALLRTNNEFIIESQNLDGTNRTLIQRGRGHCHSLAYDWVGNNIFCASSRKIDVFNLSNPNITKTLIRTLNAGFVQCQ